MIIAEHPAAPKNIQEHDHCCAGAAHFYEQFAGTACVLCGRCKHRGVLLVARRPPLRDTRLSDFVITPL